MGQVRLARVVRCSVFGIYVKNRHVLIEEALWLSICWELTWNGWLPVFLDYYQCLQMGWTQEVSNCSELKHLCDLPEARLLRMVCGSTCGCTDPLSQPFHKVGTWIFMGKTGRLWYDHFIYHFHGYFWPSPKRGGAWWLYRFMLETWRAGAGERWMQRPATWRLGWTFSLGTGQVWFRVNLVASPSFSLGERWRIFWDTYPDALSDFFGNNMSLLRRLIFSGVQQIFGMFF